MTQMFGLAMGFQRLRDADETFSLRIQRQCHANPTGDTDLTLIRFVEKKVKPSSAAEKCRNPTKKASLVTETNEPAELPGQDLNLQNGLFAKDWCSSGLRWKCFRWLGIRHF